VIEGDWSIATGYASGNAIAKRKTLPTAIFASNDHLALGVIKALKENQIRIPIDISIIGFDNIPEAAYFSPALTTVRQDFDQLGKLAINRMLMQLKENSKPGAYTIAPELIIRESTQPLKVRK
jgi:LacI family transcriptional regulator